MGIYYVYRKNCTCEGTWCTLDPNDMSVYWNFCDKHKIQKDNKIKYDFSYFIQQNIKKDVIRDV